MIITKNMWHEFAEELKNKKSIEALGDEFDSAPSGGNAEDDAEESNEQINDSSSTDELDFMGGEDGSEIDSFGGSSDGMSTGGDAGSGLGTSLNPVKNPFKGQNGRAVMDSELAELYSSVENTLESIQANVNVDEVVIIELTTLLENIKKIREVVFIQPVETTLYRWRLCVKAYEMISKQFCINIKKIKNVSSLEE
jgi:hypothetical protein